MEELLRREMIRVSHALHARGWVANHDGNVSARLDGGRLLATPTAVSKGAVTPESLIVVDATGQVVAGTRKPFSELRLHRVAYEARPDVAVVLHAHPPTATGFAVAGIPLGPPFMAEPVVSLGEEVPLIGYALVGDGALDAALASALSAADAVMLAGHGVLTVGPDLETALLRMELVEHLCRIALVARQLGGPRPLPRADVDRLLEQRKKAGLGPRSAPAGEGSAPSGWDAPASSGPSVGPGELQTLVNEALRRLGAGR